MIDNNIDELLEAIAGKTNKKEVGLSDDEKLEKLLDSYIKEQYPDSYKRVLAIDERQTLTPDAFGYLIKLLAAKSIDKHTFESTISLAMQLSKFIKGKIDIDIVDDIVNYIIFSGQYDMNIRDIIDYLFIQDTEFEFDTIGN